MTGETIGWAGAVLLSVCAVPQAIQCWRQGHGRGLSAASLLTWATGEVCLIAATLICYGWVLWMLMNYLGNLIVLCVILRYRFWPRGRR